MKAPNGMTPGPSPGGRLMEARLSCLLVIGAAYAITIYGGTRSPDSEIVFRVAESLAAGQGFAVAHDLEALKGFGVAPGLDGRSYSVFGPGESLALAPLIGAVNRLGLADRFERAPVPSYYVGHGWSAAENGQPADPDRRHVTRFLLSPFNTVVTLAGVLVLWELALMLTAHPWVATASALAYGLGTSAWAFAETYFSEPLATTLSLVSLWAILKCDTRGSTPSARSASLWCALAGLALGGAVLCHVTALLFLPFLAALLIIGTGPFEPRGRWLRLAPFAALLALPLLWLGWYDHMRFGSVFETGRTIDASRFQQHHYGVLVSPWTGIYGLLFGGSRSLLVYCPPVLLGVIGLRSLSRRHRSLAWMIAAAALTRLLFIASRSDWHGGFAPGPRLMLEIIPWLVLPAATWLADAAAGGQRLVTAAWFTVAAVGVAVEAYVCVGEPFRMFRAFKALGHQGDSLAGLYVDWSTAMLGNLHHGPTGPLLLQAVPASNLVMWLVLSAVLLTASAVIIRTAWLRARPARAVVPFKGSDAGGPEHLSAA